MNPANKRANIATLANKLERVHVYMIPVHVYVYIYRYMFHKFVGNVGAFVGGRKVEENRLFYITNKTNIQYIEMFETIVYRGNYTCTCILQKIHVQV